MKLTVELEGTQGVVDDVQEYRRRLEKSPRSVIADIANQWAQEVLPAQFDRGGDPPWAPLSAVSVKLRGDSRPLQGEGILRKSFEVTLLSDYEAEVGTELGAIHQTGGRTSPRSMIPGREIPARPFVSLTARAIDDGFQRIDDFYFGRES